MVTKEEIGDVIAGWVMRIGLAVLVGVLLSTLGLPLFFGVMQHHHNECMADAECVAQLEGNRETGDRLLAWLYAWWWLLPVVAAMAIFWKIILLGLLVVASLIPGIPVSMWYVEDDD